MLPKGLFLVLPFVTLACIAPKFAPSASPPAELGGRFGDKIIYTLTCQAEKEAKPITLTRSAERYALQPLADCGSELVTTTQRPSSQPLNVVLVLDRSASMQADLPAVKAALLTFAQHLQNQNLDVNFAVVSFHDDVNDFLISPFTPVTSLAKALGTIAASPTSDPQAAGFEALRSAFELLDAYPLQNPQRKKSRNIVVYAANSPAFAGQAHQDFSSTELAAYTLALQQRWLKEERSLELYYAVPAAPIANLASPLEQLQAFSTAASLKSTSLAFPPQGDLLAEFPQSGSQVTSTADLLCPLQSAEFRSTDTQGIPSYALLKDVYEQVSRGDPLVFTTSPDPKTTHYQLTLQRCCKGAKEESQPRASCVREEKIVIPFIFNQPR